MENQNINSPPPTNNISQSEPPIHSHSRKKLVIMGCSVLLLIILLSAFSYYLGSKNASNNKIASVEKPPLPTVSMEISKTPDATPEPDVTIKFNHLTAKAGDKIGNMIISKITAHGGSGLPTEKSAEILFTGKTSLTGNVSYSGPDGIVMSNVMCVHDLDSESLTKIPKMSSDPRSVWFCFDNFDEAKELIGTPDKPIRKTFTIDNYKIEYLPAEVWNKATLISVEK